MSENAIIMLNIFYCRSYLRLHLINIYLLLRELYSRWAQKHQLVCMPSVGYCLGQHSGTDTVQVGAGAPAFHSSPLLLSHTDSTGSPICKSVQSAEISAMFPIVLTKYVVIFLGVCMWISSQSLKICHNCIHGHFLLTIYCPPDVS